MGGASEEFPLLAAYGVEAVPILGDGNCLFNALSDQIYGHQNDHHKIRARVIEYMREHASYYKQFIDVHPGGGQRRNPKRKNAGVYATPASFKPPTPEEIDRVFESHMASMARGGTYGDNMEIVAFAAAFKTDVKIYQHSFAYMIPAPDDGTVRPVAHIAYHTWEHYSSIRNIGGPHTGLPNVELKHLSPELDARNKEAAAKVPYVAPWMINVVTSSLPYLADSATIKKTLEDCKGNIDTAVSILLDAEDRASVSSQQGSSSTERDQDSEDEFAGPNAKRIDRRMSRATKAHQKQLASEIPPPVPRLPQDAIPKPEPSPAQLPTPPPIDLPVRIHPKSPSQNAIQRLKKEDGDGWRTQSDDDSDAEFHPEFDEPDDDAVSVGSSASQSQLGVPAPKSSKPIPIAMRHNKTLQKQPGPQRKKVTARDRIDMKKAAQKAARKETKRKEALGGKGQLEATSLNINHSPPLELAGIKTLYI